MAIGISEDSMALETYDHVVATARFNERTAADGNGVWIVSTHPVRLFSRNQAIAALTLTVGFRAWSRHRQRSIVRGRKLGRAYQVLHSPFHRRKTSFSWNQSSDPNGQSRL